MSEARDIAAGRRSAADYDAAFADLHPPLTARQAAVEASRCHFCHDAPCVEACPTSIDIPGFIRRISTENPKGAGKTILAANIMGATCARVCPVEELCEQACVRTTNEHRPVAIALLQRYATDAVLDAGLQPFSRAAASGKKIAVVGAGPAGLACAHGLARKGHAVVVYEAAAKPGGLNEYGLAAYKMTNGIAGAEVEFILGVGGITVEYGRSLGADLTLDALRAEYDAVFLAIGLNGVNTLGLAGEDHDAVIDAVDYIRDIRQADDLAGLHIGSRVVVIGGGNTAIDIAVQAKRLGANYVTLAYRRGPEQMGATDFEQELAQTNGVVIRHWARPVALTGANGSAVEVTFETARLGDDGRLVATGSAFTIVADQVFKAIGQTFDETPLSTGEAPNISGGRIEADADGRTSLAGVYAGGDCVHGDDLTVAAVADGNAAAAAIDADLSA